MKRAASIYGVCMATYLAGDAIWLGTMADRFYRTQLGAMVADPVIWPPAIVFYLLFGVGLVALVVLPAADSPDAGTSAGWRRLGWTAALFGACTYGTFDLVNWATIQDWPWIVSVVDMAWGTTVTSCVAASGYAFATRGKRSGAGETQ